MLLSVDWLKLAHLAWNLARLKNWGTPSEMSSSLLTRTASSYGNGSC
jgi:hypothetical protein